MPGTPVTRTRLAAPVVTEKTRGMEPLGDNEAGYPSGGPPALLEALAALGFGVMIGSPAGRILDADERTCEIVGHTREELLALDDLATIIAPEDRHLVTTRRRDRVAGPVEPFLVHTGLIRSDGNRVQVEAVGIEIGRDSGEFRLAVLLRDATQQSNATRLVRSYERLIEYSPAGIVLWDAEGVDDALDMRLISANPAAIEATPQLAGHRGGERLGDLLPRAIELARRTFALRGTGAVDYFPDLVIGDPERPTQVHRRRAVDLGDGAIAFVLENVTGERIESMRRRRLLERLVDAGDAERRTLAFAVHDEPVQQLAAATMLVEALRRNPDAPQRDERLESVEGSLRSAMSNLRRLVFELSPPELVESGLQGALDSAVSYLFDRNDTVVTLDVVIPDEPDEAVQTAAFRIAAEALANASKHAMASHVLVDVHVEGEMLRILVCDDGCGFAPTAVASSAGLQTMRLRATALGGDCEIDSGTDGTRVDATLPLGGRRSRGGATTNRRRAAATAPPAEEIETLRRERDSLATRNERQQGKLGALQQRLDHTLQLWATLDDASLSESELVHRTLRHVAELCPDGCGIRLVAPDGESWAVVAGWHPDPEQRAFLDELLVLHGPQEASHPNTAMRGNAAVLLNRRGSTWAFGSLRTLPTPPTPINSAILAPIRADGVPFGVLTVIRDLTTERLSEADLDLLQAIADRLGTALRRTGH